MYQSLFNSKFEELLANRITLLQVACVAQIKAVFWSKGVENIFVENPETHFQVLESMEGYWIGNLTFNQKISVLIGVGNKTHQGWIF